MQAVILAGGKGTRLKPFTNIIPKPLVPIGEMPILEIVLRQLKYHGVNHIIIAVSHLARLIQAFFGDGKDLGLTIEYSMEDKILGTAGPLKLIDNLDENFIVMNGDLLTTLNYANLFEFHNNNNSLVSIATFKKEVKIDLGVLEMNKGQFVNYIEKPTYYFDVSMGIYVMNKKCVDLIPEDTKFDIPELVLKLSNDAKNTIACYSGNYDWLDIGRIDDYEAAVKLFENNKDKYLLS